MSLMADASQDIFSVTAIISVAIILTNALPTAVSIPVIRTALIRDRATRCEGLYTVFQKKFTLFLFAITKSDVDRFQ